MVVVLTPTDCERLVSVYLPNPREFPEIKQQLYYYDEDNLRIYEQVEYYDQHRSWFLGQYLQQRGEMVMMTRIDPLFVFVPILIKFCGDKYRSLDDICSSYDEIIKVKQEDNQPRNRLMTAKNQDATVKPSRLHYALSPSIKWELVADVQQVDDEMYYKFSESKTLDWLTSKFDKTMIALESVMVSEPREPGTSKATLISYAFDLINEYLPPELSDKFRTHSKINLTVNLSVEKFLESEKNPTTHVNSGRGGKRTSEYSPQKQQSQKQSVTGNNASSKKAAVTKLDPAQTSIKSFFGAKKK